MDYTAVGQTTHLAARMEQFASPGSTILTASTLELVEGLIAVKALGPVPVKGLGEPVEVYEIKGTGPARTRLHAAARRGLTRFVGRETELEQLRRVQQLAACGRGQINAVVGEAGVGKSRLFYEFTHSHRLQDWLVLEGASVSYGKATSYLRVIDLLRGYFKIHDHDDLREIREKVTGKLLTLDEALKPTLPALLTLLDLPVDETAWRTLDPRERRRRTLDAVRRLLLREAREQPVVVMFEDLHWIDSETQALLNGLVDGLGSACLLVLVNYRPEYQHTWASKTYYSQMRVDALPAESAEELLRCLLGDDPGLAPLKQLLVKRGNPFFLEEVIRTLVETKALRGMQGQYRLTQPIQGIQVPATVQAVLAARIDRLSEEDKRHLQVASVVGKDIPFALLQEIAELPEETLRRGLDRLQSAEFLYESSRFPDPRYAFKHALTHEVTYSGLLHDRRRRLHARIVDAIERLHHDRLGEYIERLAHHALRGELQDRAVHYLRLAGLRATERSALPDAATWFEQALSVRDDATPALVSVTDRCWLVSSLAHLGRFDAAADHAAEAIRIAEPTHRAITIGMAHLGATTLRLLKGEWARARSLSERWIAVTTSGNVLLQLPLAISCSAWALAQLGEANKALNRLEEGERVLERSELVFQHGWGLQSLGRACLLLDRLDDALRFGDRAIECSSSHPGNTACALHLLGDVATHPDRFDADRGEAYYRQALTVAEPRGMRPLVAQCHLGLGKLYRRASNRHQARGHLTMATAMYQEMEMKFWLQQAKAEMRRLG